MYWSERQKQLYAGLEKDEAALKRRLITYYSEESASLDKDIAAYYQKYGENGVIKYRTLKESLSNEERQLLMRNCDEFAKKYPQYADLIPIRKSIYKLDRLEGLQCSIMLHQYNIGAITQAELDKHLRRQALKGVNAAQEALGFGKNFYAENADVINLFVGVPWANGKDFSQIIWDNADKLINYLKYDFASGIARGDSYQKLTAALQNRFLTVNKNDAYRLIYTEGTYVMAESTMQPFKEDFEQYKVSTAADGKVCSKCADISHQVFYIKDRTPGVNFPPLHPWCRCTFEIYVEDWDKWQDDYVKRHSKNPDKILQFFRQNANMIDDGSNPFNHPVTQESIDLVPFIKFDEFSNAQNLFIYNERKRLLQSLINSPTGQENSLIVRLDNLKPYSIIEGINGKTAMSDVNELYYGIHNHPDCGVLSPGDIFNFLIRDKMLAVEALANDGSVTVLMKTKKSRLKDYEKFLTESIEQFSLNHDIDVSKNFELLNKFCDSLLKKGVKYGFKYIKY